MELGNVFCVENMSLGKTRDMFSEFGTIKDKNYVYDTLLFENAYHLRVDDKRYFQVSLYFKRENDAKLHISRPQSYPVYTMTEFKEYHGRRFRPQLDKHAFIKESEEILKKHIPELEQSGEYESGCIDVFYPFENYTVLVAQSDRNWKEAQYGDARNYVAVGARYVSSDRIRLSDDTERLFARLAEMAALED